MKNTISKLLLILIYISFAQQLNAEYNISSASYFQGNSCKGEITVSIDGDAGPFMITICNNDNENYPCIVENGVISRSSSIYQELNSGSYTVVIKDAFECLYTENVNIDCGCTLEIIGQPNSNSLPSNCSSSDGEIYHNFANGGGSTFIINQSNPVSYSWSTGIVTFEPRLSNLTPGVYGLTITDANQCTDEVDIELFSKADLQIFDYEINNSCSNTSNGSIGIVVQPISSNLQYSWSNGSTSSYIDNLNDGIYCITVTDTGTNCVFEDCFEVMEIIENPISDLIIELEDYCESEEEGYIRIEIVDGNGPFEFIVNGSSYPNSDRVLELYDLQNGQYNIEVIDYCGSSLTESVTIENCEIMVTYIVENTSPNSNTGAIHLFLDGEDCGNYMTQWSNGITHTTNSPSLLNLEAGTYSAVISNDQCQIILVFEVEECSSTNTNIRANIVEFNENSTSCPLESRNISFEILNFLNEYEYYVADNEGIVVQGKSSNSDLQFIDLEITYYTLFYREVGDCFWEEEQFSFSCVECSNSQSEREIGSNIDDPCGGSLFGLDDSNIEISWGEVYNNYLVEWIVDDVVQPEKTIINATNNISSPNVDGPTSYHIDVQNVEFYAGVRIFNIDSGCYYEELYLVGSESISCSPWTTLLGAITDGSTNYNLDIEVYVGGGEVEWCGQFPQSYDIDGFEYYPFDENDVCQGGGLLKPKSDCNAFTDLEDYHSVEGFIIIPPNYSHEQITTNYWEPFSNSIDLFDCGPVDGDLCIFDLNIEPYYLEIPLVVEYCDNDPTTEIEGYDCSPGVIGHVFGIPVENAPCTFDIYCYDQILNQEVLIATNVSLAEDCCYNPEGNGQCELDCYCPYLNCGRVSYGSQSCATLQAQGIPECIEPGPYNPCEIFFQEPDGCTSVVASTVPNESNFIAIDYTGIGSPTLLLSPISNEENDAVIGSVSSLTNTGFNVKLKEWSSSDGIHSEEIVSYLYSQPGVYNYGSLKVQFENIENVNHEFKTITFQEPFDIKPIVLTTQITDNESTPAIVRIKNVSKTGFDIKLQEEANGTNHVFESISFMAIETGTDSIDGKVLTAKRVNVSSSWKNIHSQNNYNVRPLFLANLQTYNEADPAYLRYRVIHNNRFQVKIEESGAGVGTHVNEHMGYIYFENIEDCEPGCDCEIQNVSTTDCSVNFDLVGDNCDNYSLIAWGPDYYEYFPEIAPGSVELLDILKDGDYTLHLEATNIDESVCIDPEDIIVQVSDCIEPSQICSSINEDSSGSNDWSQEYTADGDGYLIITFGTYNIPDQLLVYKNNVVVSNSDNYSSQLTQGLANAWIPGCPVVLGGFANFVDTIVVNKNDIIKIEVLADNCNFGNTEWFLNAECFGPEELFNNNSNPAFKKNTVADFNSSNSEIGQIEELEIFPNPVSGELNITYKNFNDPIALYVLNSSGEMVFYRIDQIEKNYRLDVSRFSSGLYFLYFTSGKYRKIEKIIVE